MSQLLDHTKTEVVTSDQAKEQIDNYLLNVLSAKITQATRVHPNYERLWQSVKTLYSAGGKRLRPYMTLLMYQAYSNKPIDTIIPAAAAQELLHQAMLIHDDIIDRDTVRYNIKNVSGQYGDTYKELLPTPDEVRHFADSSALLAGDLLISEAHAQLASTPVDTVLLAQAQELLNQAVFHVAGGELLDTEATFYGETSIDPITIAEQKTASYSFIGPLTIGAVLGGADDKQKAYIQQLGTSAGIAYQLRDDIIGIFGEEAKTGKSADGDIREGKRTLLIDEFYKRATVDQKQAFEKVFRNATATKEDVQLVRELLVASGAKQAIESYIENYRLETLENINALTISQAHQQMITALITASLDRDK